MGLREKLLGKKGERLTEVYLKKKRFKILGRNLRCKFGELDLVGLHKETMVFVEVRLKTSSSSILPEETITHEKKKHIIRSALAFQARYKLENFSLRFDVVFITLRRWPLRPEICHIEDAFEGE